MDLAPQIVIQLIEFGDFKNFQSLKLSLHAFSSSDKMTKVV